jgi:ATP-dependent DNA helicase RecQ
MSRRNGCCNGTLERLSRLELALFAIDEAHCVSANGATNSARNIASSKLPARFFPGVPRVALTATADPRTRDDILAALAMEHARGVRRQLPSAEPASPPAPKSRRDRATAGFAEAPPGECGIVYCGSAPRPSASRRS